MLNFPKDELIQQVSSNLYSLQSLVLGGALNKWYHLQTRTIVKEARYLSDISPYQSHLVECLGSKLCEWLSIPSVRQEECLILELDSSRTVASCCRDFRSTNLAYVPFSKMLTSNEVGINDYARFSFHEKLDAIMNSFRRWGISDSVDFISDMCLIDFILLNPDRHTDNFGLLYDSSLNQSTTAPLFDFGMGLKAYDRISIFATVNVVQELEFKNPFALNLSDALREFGSKWKDRLSLLPRDQIIEEAMRGLTTSRREMVFNLIDMIRRA